MQGLSVERRRVAVVCLALIGSCAGSALGGVVAQLLDLEPLVPAFAGTLAGIVACCAVLRRRLAQRLPSELDGWFQRRRKLRWLWGVSVVLAIANTARIGLFAADPSQLWASAFPPVEEAARHQCVSAYVRAGELAATGHDNLWDPALYEEGGATEVVGLAPYLGDPYEYPPVLAVAPRVAVAATNDYQLLRDLWFGISAVGFLVAFIAIAAWMRGRAGATTLLLLPAIMLSSAVMFGLQFGQVHLLVVAASVAGMMQLARGRTKTGATLLAFAIATKIFPGLLLVHLAVRRQWRAIGATLAALAAMFALATIVLGPGTIAAFVTEHLPRIASGEAFAFAEGNPDNVSLYGLAFKLAALGVDGAGRELAMLLAWIWTAIAVALAIFGSRLRGLHSHGSELHGSILDADPARAADVLVWLAIVCLGTLRSPFAPLYTAIGVLWVLAVAVSVRGWNKALVVIAWILLQGAPPLGAPAADALVSLPMQAITIAVAVLAAWPRRDAARTV